MKGGMTWRRGACVAKGGHVWQKGGRVWYAVDSHCAGGTHPTGMSSSIIFRNYYILNFRTYLQNILQKNPKKEPRFISTSSYHKNLRNTLSFFFSCLPK